ncbi:retrotransposon protein, putative, ty1-copia subclass [Tanacetum coccineum]
MVRSMMNQTNLPISFWDYALESDARILNMVPTKKVEKPPYELWHGKVPNLSYLKVWGCEALVKYDTPRKLEPRSVKCIFVGYLKKTMGYYFYYPYEHKIIVARYSKLFENSLISQEASGSHEDLEIIQDEMHILMKTLAIITMRSNMKMLNHKHGLGDHGEPANYKAALSESGKWLEAMNVKMQSMKDNEVWSLIDLQSNAKTVGRKWFFKKKADMHGNVHTYKAHFLAKGLLQLNYEETLSPIKYIKSSY